MTIISILNDDFEILFDDETVGGLAVAGMRMVRRASGASTTVYTTNALYSAIAESTDEFIAMGFKNPMLPVTPNAYTMENNFFIPKSSTEFLDEGAIDADWTVTSGDGVWRKVFDSGGTPPVSGDIGRQVVEATSGDKGTLLDFETEPDGITVLWIRPDTSTDLFDEAAANLETTTDGGGMTVTGNGVATSGRTLFSSIQAIGSVPTATEVYLYQDRQKMTDSTGAFQWWATDTTVSLGIIDILIRVINAGSTVADGDVEVFARRYTSLYDNFRLNVVAGGRSALPLASAADINNTTGYETQTVIDSSGTGAFVVGEIANEGVSLASVVITSVAGDSANPILEYYYVGDETIALFSSGAQTLTAPGSGATLLTLAPTQTVLGPTGTLGASVTINLGGFYTDHDGDASNEPYSVQVDTQGNVPIAIVYEVLKYRTRRGAGSDDAQGGLWDNLGSGTQIPGEAYRGLDGIFEYDAFSGIMTEGENIFTTTSSSTWTARLLHDNTTAVGGDTYISVTDQQTSVDSIGDNHVIEDESGSSDVTVHAGGTVGFISISSPKSSPLGTFTGSQIFGARGVSYVNPHSNDGQAYTLTDDLGVLRVSPNTVFFNVGGTILGDRVFVARDTGVTGIIDKDQFGGLVSESGTFNGLGDQIVRVAGTVDTEVPITSVIRIVENTLQQEHHYVYSSRTAVVDGEFTLLSIPTSTATSTSTTQLIDTTGDFINDGVEVGMMVRNTFGGKTTHVWEITRVDSDGQTLDVSPLYGSPDDWDSGDGYEINRLIQDYAATDDIYDLIIDVEADNNDPTSNSFVKILASDFGTVVNVRQGKIILPFTQNQNQSDGNTTVTVVRSPDTIAV